MATTNGKRARDNWTLDDKVVAARIDKIVNDGERTIPVWVRDHLESKGWGDKASDKWRFQFCHELLGHNVVDCHRLNTDQKSANGQHLITWKHRGFCKSSCSGHTPLEFASNLHLLGCNGGKSHTVVPSEILDDTEVQRGLRKKMREEEGRTMTSPRRNSVSADTSVPPPAAKKQAAANAATSGPSTPPMTPPAAAPAPAPMLMPPHAEVENFVMGVAAQMDLANAAMSAFTAAVRANQQIPELMRNVAPYLGANQAQLRSPEAGAYFRQLLTAAKDNADLRKEIAAKDREIQRLQETHARELAEAAKKTEAQKKETAEALRKKDDHIAVLERNLLASEKEVTAIRKEVQGLRVELDRTRKQVPAYHIDAGTAASGMEALARQMTSA